MEDTDFDPQVLCDARNPADRPSCCAQRLAPQVAAVGRGGLGLDINELDDNECSPLHIALLKGTSATHEATRPGMSLHERRQRLFSISVGHLEVAEVLLSRGASVKLLCEGSPPLVLAVCTAAHTHRRDRAAAAVKLLLDHGALPNQR